MAFNGYAKRGVDIRKGEAGSRAQLKRYGLVVVKSEIDGGLKNQILTLQDTTSASARRRGRRSPSNRTSTGFSRRS